MAVREHDRWRVSDVTPAGGRRQVCPGVGDGIVDCAEVGESELVIVVFSAGDHQSTVGQDRGGEVGWNVSGGKARKFGPSPFDITAGDIGGELVPIGRGVALRRYGAVGQLKSNLDSIRRLMHECG